MNKTLNKLKDGVLVGIGFLIVLGVASAWTNLSSVNSGDTLTSTIWNDMVTKLNDAGQRASGIFTDGTNHVGIGTNSPITRLEVSGDISTKGGQVVMERPVTVGGRARGLMYTPDGTADPTNNGLAGIGLYGTNTTENAIFLSFGTAPWTSTTGMRILSNGNVGIGLSSPTSELDVNGKIRGLATYSYDPSSTTLSFTNTTAVTFSDIQTSISVQSGDVVKVDLACNLRNDTAYMLTYMRASLYSGTATTKLGGNRITTGGGSATSERIGGSSMGLFKATADGTLTFRAEGHVSGGTGNAVYCNIVAYVIGKE